MYAGLDAWMPAEGAVINAFGLRRGCTGGAWADVPRGRMSPDHVVRLLQDVAAAYDVVGLAVPEYMPWEAITMHNMLRKLPLLAGRR
jgi:hypothetical protein